MQILMNSQPVDFSLEDEGTVSDVITSILEWSQERGLVFINVVIDEEVFLLDNLPDRNVSDIEEINCVIQSKSDIVFSSADEAVLYCDRVLLFTEQVKESQSIIEDDNIINLVDGIQWLGDVITYIIHLLGLELDQTRYRDETVEKVLEDIGTLGANIKEHPTGDYLLSMVNDIEEEIRGVKDLVKILVSSEEMKTLIMESIDSPDVLMISLESLKEELPVQITNLEHIAVKFQEGADHEASERLGHFVDFIYRYTRLCFQVVPVFGIDLGAIVVDELSLEEKNRELQDQLNEILEVMENDDIVSLTDIMEYEMKDSMEEVQEYLEKLSSELGKSEKQQLE